MHGCQRIEQPLVVHCCPWNKKSLVTFCMIEDFISILVYTNVYNWEKLISVYINSKNWKFSNPIQGGEVGFKGFTIVKRKFSTTLWKIGKKSLNTWLPNVTFFLHAKEIYIKETKNTPVILTKIYFFLEYISYQVWWVCLL